MFMKDLLHLTNGSIVELDHLGDEVTKFASTTACLHMAK